MPDHLLTIPESHDYSESQIDITMPLSGPYPPEPSTATELGSADVTSTPPFSGTCAPAAPAAPAAVSTAPSIGGFISNTRVENPASENCLYFKLTFPGGRKEADNPESPEHLIWLFLPGSRRLRFVFNPGPDVPVPPKEGSDMSGACFCFDIRTRVGGIEEALFTLQVSRL